MSGLAVVTRRRASSKTELCVLLIVTGSLVSLWLRAQVPVNALGFGIGYFDDGLFARGAIALGRGEWLGPFDVLTLSKGPSYPLFIALTHYFGIPLPIGEQLTYLLGCGVLAACFWRVTRRPVAASFIYLVLAFDPANFSTANDRILRDSWYSGLSLLLVGLLFFTMHCAVTRSRLVLVLPLAVLTGLIGTLFWLCRDEGAWLVPSVMILVIALPIVALRSRCQVRGRLSPTGRELIRRGISVAVTVALMGGISFAAIAAVRQKNESAYGVSLTSDFAGGCFRRRMRL